MNNIRILFVCMGNICRSPTAHGVFRDLLAKSGLIHRVHLDSAGTHAYHVGEHPDRRAQKAAWDRNIDLSDLEARRVGETDFEYFDLIVAMDADNLRHLRGSCPQEHQHKLKLFMEYAPQAGLDEVPDPYYGGPTGFERVLDLVTAASLGLLQEVRTRLDG